MMTRKLDALVAEKVMGWKRPDGGQVGWVRFSGDVGYLATANWSPSAGIAAAWQVVEKIKIGEQMPSFGLAWYNGRWVVSWQTDDPNNVFGFNDATADTAPLAICKAALLAVGVDEDTINEAMGE